MVLLGGSPVQFVYIDALLDSDYFKTILEFHDSPHITFFYIFVIFLLWIFP